MYTLPVWVPLLLRSTLGYSWGYSHRGNSTGGKLWVQGKQGSRVQR